MCILLKSRFILFLPIVDKHSKVYQTGILRVNQIFECVYPNGHKFFFRETQNFENVPKRPFASYNETQNFENCTQAAICFLTTKHIILKVVPKPPFTFLTRKYEI